jgi:UPF0755 protein
MNKIKIFFILVLFLLFFLLLQLLDFFFKPLAIFQTKHFFISPGMSTQAVAEALYKENYIAYPRLFHLIAKLEGRATHLKSGEYIFGSGISAQQILNKIVHGDYVTYSLTLPEGWTLRKIRAELNSNTHINHLTTSLSPQAIATLVGSPKINPEGLFFPDTYVFSWGKSDRDILKAAYRKMQTVLTQHWEDRAPNLPYLSSYEALIVAYLVENEAKLDSEKPLIAGVILTRLKKHMPLQIDSTIIYALGEQYQGKITKAALGLKSPYNSYLQQGFPPTPISSPGLASLQAALHPIMSNNIYFVARGNGSHEFSTDLQSHHKAVKKYIMHQAS